jgi:hypothetical protein
VVASGIASECLKTVAVLLNPVVLLKSATAPVAVFAVALLGLFPEVRKRAPVAVLKLPIVLLLSEKKPTAVL